MNNEVVKLAIVVDDVILFLSDPIAHILRIFKALQTFGQVSGYKVNAIKSEVVNIGRFIPTLTWQAIGIPIHVAPKYITYLGIKIGKSSDSLYMLNYPIFTKIQADLDRWSHLPLSLAGRCYLLKMSGFARLLYPLQTLPLLLKH